MLKQSKTPSGSFWKQYVARPMDITSHTRIDFSFFFWITYEILTGQKCPCV